MTSRFVICCPNCNHCDIVDMFIRYEDGDIWLICPRCGTEHRLHNVADPGMGSTATFVTYLSEDVVRIVRKRSGKVLEYRYVTIRVPREIAQRLGLRRGDRVRVTLSKA